MWTSLESNMTHIHPKAFSVGAEAPRHQGLGSSPVRGLQVTKLPVFSQQIHIINHLFLCSGTDFKMSILGQSAVKHSSNKSLGTMVTGSSLAHETQVIQGFRIPATVNPEDGLRLPSRHLCLAHKFSKTIQTGLQIVSWSLSPQSRVSVCVCVWYDRLFKFSAKQTTVQTVPFSGAILDLQLMLLLSLFMVRGYRNYPWLANSTQLYSSSMDANLWWGTDNPKTCLPSQINEAVQSQLPIVGLRKAT